MKWNGLPTLIYGTSGISKEVKVLIDEINQGSYCNIFDVLGFVCEKNEDIGQEILNKKAVCSDNDFEMYISTFPQLGVVIPIGTPALKKKIYQRISKYTNLVYPNLISPSACIMDRDMIELGIGNIICSGTRLTTEIRLGDFNLINLNTTIGHNTILGNFNVINPLASISGGVEMENEILVGTGSCIKQGKKVLSKSIIGMGAIITSDVSEEAIMICDKAHEME